MISPSGQPGHARSRGTPRRRGSIERGQYLAIAADCSACHTAPGGKPFAGGLAIDSPIGAIYSTNITPDREPGSANIPSTISTGPCATASRAKARRCIRRCLIPHMRMSDEDIAALYAYFMLGVEPFPPGAANGIALPLSIRWPLAIWRKLFAPSPDGPVRRVALRRSGRCPRRLSRGGPRALRSLPYAARAEPRGEGAR